MIVQNSRIQMKYSTISGVVPTIPLSDDHTDGTWQPTDLYVGEIFLNTTDNLAWWRSQTGLIPFGATGGTSVFIGDFVPASIGGTYGGPVYGPEFNGTLIYGGTVEGVTGTFTGPVSASTYYGDGSNLTGIVSTWNGGVVGNTAQFQNDVTFDTTIFVDEIDSIGPELQINAPIVTNAGATFNGTVTAVSFIGDGSQLTGITGGTDTYTVAATLVGNTIQFDRNDLANAYSVDLTSIASAPVISIGWDNTINEFTLELADGTIFQLPITQFTDLIVTGSVTADYFVGDGSLLTNLPITTGPTGATGADGATGPQGNRSVMNLSYTGSSLTIGIGTVSLPITTPIVNLGWQQGTRVRIWHDATNYMEGQITTSITNPQTTNIDVNIDYIVGSGSYGSWYVGIAGDLGAGSSQNLEQTLLIGNTSGPYNISMNNDQLIAHGAGSGEFGLRFTTDPVSTDIKWTYIHGDADGGYARVGVDNTTAEDWAVARMQTRNPDDTGADIFLTRGDNNITLSTFDIAGAGANLDITPGVINNDVYVGADITTIQQTPISITITNPNTTNPGIQYAADYSANFTNRTLVDKGYVDGLISTPNLQSVLSAGNTSGNQNIVFNNYYGLENSSGEADIKMDPFQIDIIHKKFTTGTDWKRGLFQGSGHNGTASITGDDYNVTADLYRASSLDVTNTYARLFYQETAISTGDGYQTYAQINKDNILISSAYNSTLANSNFAGLQYNHDYSAQFTARSLVDKEYVDNIANSLILTETVGDITDTFEIDVAVNNFGTGLYSINNLTGDNTLSNWNPNGFSTDVSSGVNLNQFRLNSTQFTSNIQDATNTSIITQDANSIIISGIGGGFAGIQYDIDYSTNFTNRSLVDKEYVDNAIVGSFIPPVSPLEVFRGRSFRYDSTTVDTYGGIATVNNASALGIVTGTTNFYNRFVRLRYYASVVATGRQTDIRGTDLQWYRSAGFRFVTTFRVADTVYGSTTQQFYGLGGYTVQLPYGGASLIQLENLVNIIGVGSNATDTNLQIYHNDGTGTCTKVDLGANFPANRTAGAEMTTMYTIEIYNSVGSNDVKYLVKNLETGAQAQGTLTTNLPATTQGLTIFASRCMGTPTTNTGQFELHKWGCSDIAH